MNTKICNKCGIVKDINEFEFRTDTNKYRNTCKQCKKDYLKKYVIKNKERLQDYRKSWYLKHQKEKLEYQKKYLKDNADIIKEKGKKYRERNKLKIHDYKINYYKKNKNFVLEQNKKYREENIESIRLKQKQYVKENRNRINEYVRVRKEKDKIFKLKCQVRNMLWESFNRKYIKKKFKGENIVGCNIDDFILYLLKTFYMNYGYEWDGVEDVHIDHIIPLATAKTEEEVIKLCHYTNLQLLKVKDNLEKSSKLKHVYSNESN